MAQYIERAKVMDALIDNTSIVEAINAIFDIPAESVRLAVLGEWRKLGKTGCIFVCSSCDKTFPYKTDFCPHCGADMRR